MVVDGRIFRLQIDGAFELLHGTDISEGPDTVPDELFDELFLPPPNLAKPEVFVGALIGAMLVFFFSGLAIKAVGKAAYVVIQDVREQFKEHPGIMKGTELPDYGRTVDIVTRGALRQIKPRPASAAREPDCRRHDGVAPGLAPLPRGSLSLFPRQQEFNTAELRTTGLGEKVARLSYAIHRQGPQAL